MTIATPTLTIGEPDVAGALAVFPILGPTSSLEYAAFATAVAQGLRVTELEPQASVNDLLVINPLPIPVLLYEGEELRGAQQDRTVDTSTLIAANTKQQLRVSCVEHGRWDQTRHQEAFTPAPVAAYPALRRLKRQTQADQGQVWNEVARAAQAHAAPAPTGAMRDVFAARTPDRQSLTHAVGVKADQLGAVACVGGQPVVIDLVGRADVFAVLHGPLVEGYALDALDRPACAPPDAAVIARLVDDAVAHGPALHHDGELVALTAFPTPPAKARITRPSRRSR